LSNREPHKGRFRRKISQSTRIFVRPIPAQYRIFQNPTGRHLVVQELLKIEVLCHIVGSVATVSTLFAFQLQLPPIRDDTHVPNERLMDKRPKALACSNYGLSSFG
jgi:hypothetical protein